LLHCDIDEPIPIYHLFITGIFQVPFPLTLRFKPMLLCGIELRIENTIISRFLFSADAALQVQAAARHCAAN
jgi:hypothetical protein